MEAQAECDYKVDIEQTYLQWFQLLFSMSLINNNNNNNNKNNSNNNDKH